MGGSGLREMANTESKMIIRLIQTKSTIWSKWNEGQTWKNQLHICMISWIVPWATTAMVGQQMERRPATWAMESVRDRANTSGLLLPTTACAISKKLHRKADCQHWHSDWVQTVIWLRPQDLHTKDSKLENRMKTCTYSSTGTWKYFR